MSNKSVRHTNGIYNENHVFGWVSIAKTSAIGSLGTRLDEARLGRSNASCRRDGLVGSVASAAPCTCFRCDYDGWEEWDADDGWEEGDGEEEEED